MTNPLPAPSTYFTAQVASKRLAARIHLSVVERLAREMSVPGRELSGILLGTAGDAVTVEDYQTVKQDREAMDRAVKLWQPDAESKIRVVGLFRTDGRAKRKPNASDAATLARLLPESDGVLLLIGPEPAPAVLYFVEGGQFRHRSARVAFPLDRQALASGNAGRLQLAAPPPEKKRTNHRILFRGALAFGAVASVLGAGLAGYEVARVFSEEPATPAPVHAAATLGLTTERNGPELVLRWNPAAPALATAARGRLSVTDGSNIRDIDLAPSELRRGQVSYMPGTNDVTFRMEIFDDQQKRSATEWKRVLSASAPLTAGFASTAVTTPAAAVKPTGTFFGGGIVLRVKGPRPAAPPRAPEMLGAPPEILAPNPPMGEAVVPAGPERLPGPPAEASATPAEPVILGGEVQGPALVFRTLPEYPAEAARQHLAGTVRITAIIDAQGAVKNPRATGGPMLLREPAVRAVREWKYRPASLNGRPIEVETELEVVFKADE
jgi:TonB family protein